MAFKSAAQRKLVMSLLNLVKKSKSKRRNVSKSKRRNVSKFKISIIGKNKDIELVAGTQTKVSNYLANIVMNQSAIKKLLKIFSSSKKGSITPKELKRYIKKSISSTRPMGTYDKTKVAIDIGAVLKMKGRPSGVSLRNVVYHEKFHKDVPILGRSELLAHGWGGLHQKKVRKLSDVGTNVKDATVAAFAHFPISRPSRAIIEFGALGAGTGVGYVGYKKYKKKKSK